MKMKAKRVFLIVLDSVGAGEAPDSASFGDSGANTLKSIFDTGLLKIDTLKKHGIGHIEGLDFFGKEGELGACVARCRELSAGKDTTVGHWEIAGHISKKPLPTFPDGFPEDILEKVRRISGRNLLCNKPYSGTAVISDYGSESLSSGRLIVYTSADSVLQIAAHTDMVPLEELYNICQKLRDELVGEDDGVGRIIARPFVGDEKNGFVRTADRRDYSLLPPVKLLPRAVKEAGLDSISVGKIYDIFASDGFTEAVRTHSNNEGMRVTGEYANKDFCGLCFLNLVDFDMAFGHRRDASGYAFALNEFDEWLANFIEKMSDDDVLVITADHGCDPAFMKSTDHTREYTPLIIYGKNVARKNLGTVNGFADIGATVADMLGVDFVGDGNVIEIFE